MKHPILSHAESVIRDAAALLEGEGFQRRQQGKEPYGIPEALAEASIDFGPVARVVAERQLVNHGIDIWWNDLLCVDGDDAAARLRELVPIDPAGLYGENWQPNLGLLALAARCDASTLNGLGNVIGTNEWTAFEQSVEVARQHGRELTLMHLCEDVNFCVPHAETTPAGLNRRLRGIRALECVAAQQTLHDVLSAGMASTLIKMMLPLQWRI